jgi:cation diffusion facilitator CzcD-associated flavoprotein CzcO
MTKIWQGVKSERRTQALEALARAARRDLALINFPAANWVPPRQDRDGKPLLDVLVIGVGMCGQTAAFALMRDGIRNFRIVDKATPGDEGPWSTYARMQILRSPKHITSPDLGVPSLTFRAWYEAQHGEAGWQSLHKIGRIDWRDYLVWIRETVGIPVENGVTASELEPTADGVRVTLTSPAGREQITARKIVLAGGREGSGAIRTPHFPGLEQAAEATTGRVFHSSDAIDFAALKGQRIAVLGASASAFDNAAEALEAGAAVVDLYCRRPHLPQVNKSKWASFPGMFKGFIGLDDATRFRIFGYILEEATPPPYESVLRCDAHVAFAIRFGEPWRDLIPSPSSVEVVTDRTRLTYDVAILCTGFDVDVTERPELAAVSGNILLWKDRVSAAESARHAESARFPYLGPGFELLPRDAARTPGISHLHVFNWGVTQSHAAVAGDIPGLATGAWRLSEAICRALLAADIATHERALLAHEDGELIPTTRYVALDKR